MKERLLRPLWQRLFKSDFSFIVLLFVLLGVIRIIGLVIGEINIVVLGFLIMWFIPIVFLHKKGRVNIGIKKPNNWGWLFISFLIGIAVALGIYWIGYLLYGNGAENWGMTIVSEYSSQEEAIVPVVFMVITFMSMLFSPIGEELFFRGVIHEVLAERLSSYKWAGFWSSFSFAIVHIPHHELVFTNKGILNMLIPILLWSIIMFLVSYLFIYARRKTGSILGSIVCHSGYILGMNLFVYWVLL